MSATQQELLRGWAIHQQRRYSEAEAIYRRVLAIAPNDAAAWCYLGIALHDQRKYQASIEAYRQSLKLQPDFPVALNNLGNSLRYTNDIDEADRCFQKAIDLKPDYLNAFKNRGTLHVWTGNVELGLSWYEKALQINPNDAELHRNLGVIYLLQGRFEEGWKEYRWRWLVGDLKRLNIPVPVWQGGDPQGLRLLLTAEQGLGDTLNFVRFGRWLGERGAKVVIHCQPALTALLQQSPEVGVPYPNSILYEGTVDAHCSLLDVADLLNLNASTIPAYEGYLRPSPNLVKFWEARMPKRPGVFRVGINWQGNPDHQADMFRSIPLKCFEQLSKIPNVELISLQSGFGVEQIAQWQGAKPLKTIEGEVDKTSGAFMDTAAILKHLDLLITSDTSIAHLGGAINFPTWVVLNYTPDWRWLLNRSDSPWYPSVRLFRQPKIGDWQSAFDNIESQLTKIAGAV